MGDTRVSGMDSNFDMALDKICGIILTFDLSNFTIKKSAPPEVQHVLVNSHFSKSFQDM